MDFVIENIFLIVIALVSGGMLVWPVIMRRSAGPSLTPTAATRLMNDTGAVVVDVREAPEFNAGHLPQARHIPLGDLDKRVRDLPADKPVIVMCASGPRAARAAATLRKAGREQVFVLDGGIQGWRDAGLPLVR